MQHSWRAPGTRYGGERFRAPILGFPVKKDTLEIKGFDKRAVILVTPCMWVSSERALVLG